LRFAVRWPGSPEASPRSHGVPRRDVPGRVHVSVTGVSAGRACELRLALARFRIHVPARRAPLTRERGVDPLHPTGSLLLQAPRQQAPSRPQDPPVQSGLLADVPARTVWRGPDPWRSSRPSPCAGPFPGHTAERSRASPSYRGWSLASQIFSFTSAICSTVTANFAYRATSRRTFSTSPDANCRPTVPRPRAVRVHKNRGPWPG
jgi:hypothetical protein